MGNKQNDIVSIFQNHHKKTYTIVFSILQNVEDAEDVTQEVFIEVFRSINNFRQDSAFSTWIYRIAVNKSLDFVKSRQRKKRLAFFTQLINPSTGEVLKEISHFEHPGVLLENKERAQLLFKAINLLNTSQKLAFTLSQIDKLSQKTIAEIMNLSEKAIESLIQRAKVNLRKTLGEYYHNRRI